MRTKLIILSIIAMALVVMAFPTNKFQPKTVWEHYCKYTLHIHPSQATEDQYDYFLDCWSGDDEYQYLYDYYENKYPEYNNQQSPARVESIDTKALSHFLYEDQGYIAGFREYGYYIAARALGIKSEKEYMDRLTDIKRICNRL